MTIEVHVLSAGLPVTPQLAINALERAMNDVMRHYANIEGEDLGDKPIVVQSSYQMSRVQTIIKP